MGRCRIRLRSVNLWQEGLSLHKSKRLRWGGHRSRPTWILPAQL